MSEFRSKWLDWTPQSRGKSESEPSPSGHHESQSTPFDRLQSDWADAWVRAEDGFAMNGISPSHETMQAATAIELEIGEGGSHWPGVTVEDLKEWAQQIYAGRSSARISSDGRVVLRSVRRAEWGETK